MNQNMKQRNSNVELLRIMSIILIIAHHYVIHGYNLLTINNIYNRIILGITSLGGKLGVSCFILITGYYMINSTLNLKKIFKLIFEVLIYSLLCFSIYSLLKKSFNINLFIKSILPIGTNEYWFITDYIILVFCSPFINIIINQISKSIYTKSLILCVFFWSFLPTFFNIDYAFNDLIWFFVLYFFGGYIKKYLTNTNKESKKFFAISIFSYCLIIFSNIFFILLGAYTNIDLFNTYSTHFSILNSPFILLSSIELFRFFISLPKRNSFFINMISSTSLGIYLLHDNYLIRPFLWNNILKCGDFKNTGLLILHIIFSITAIFIIGVLIDLIRQKTFDRVFIIYFDKVIYFVQNNNFIKKLSHVIKNMIIKFI